jgi:hypothetical protein
MMIENCLSSERVLIAARLAGDLQAALGDRQTFNPFSVRQDFVAASRG